MRIMATTGAAALALVLAACSGGTDTTTNVADTDIMANDMDMNMNPMTPGNMMAAGTTAVAMLKTANGENAGQATVTEADGGLHVTFAATGLPEGTHAVHIHTTGTCDAPDFTSAGGHWNPTGAHHGINNPESPKPHLGDLPNMEVAADGTGSLDFDIAGGTMAGLLDADGAALVVHADPDDLKSDPSGNAGGRIACGVFAAQ